MSNLDIDSPVNKDLPPNFKYRLEEYARVFPSAIPKHVLDDILLNLKNIEYEQHTFFRAKDETRVTKSGSKELDVSHDYYNYELMDIIRRVIWDYLVYFNFAWIDGWSGFTPPRWNMYKETRKMAIHADRIKSMFDGERKGDPTLSVLSLLNDDFEGGEFVLFEDTIVPMKAGDILVFPSTFMYPHKVEPVTSGVRYSCISWVW